VSWADPAWAGTPISYAANALTTGGQAAPTVIGIFTPMAQSWVGTSSKSLAAVGQPANTIMVAEKHNTDVVAFGSAGVSTGFCGDMFYGKNLNNFDWCSPMEEPNGTNLSTAAYPNGPNGAVSAKHQGRANFLFADGHVKSMFPYATNPDPINRPKDNLWDATRQ